MAGKHLHLFLQAFIESDVEEALAHVVQHLAQLGQFGHSELEQLHLRMSSHVTSMSQVHIKLCTSMSQVHVKLCTHGSNST